MAFGQTQNVIILPGALPQATVRRGLRPKGILVKSRLLSCVIVVSSLSAGPWLTRAVAADGPIIFHDATRQTGITFQHTDGGSGRHYIAETVASGLATFDYDGDGLIDVYFLSGRLLPGPPWSGPARNALYRNLGDFRFVDVTDQAGVGDAGYGHRRL